MRAGYPHADSGIGGIFPFQYVLNYIRGSNIRYSFYNNGKVFQRFDFITGRQFYQPAFLERVE
jgi:hypothetical protein